MMLRTSSGILAEIVDQKKLELAGLRGCEKALEQAAHKRPGAARDFALALRAKVPAIIAEIKKASPSKGVLQANFHPAAMAQAYEAGGAACVSVLTDRHFFQGSLEDLQAARAAVSLPVIRKDFVIDPLQIFEAAAYGADAILLIAAILTTVQLRQFRELATGLGLAALVEVHDADELKEAVDSGAEIIGVNNRNLDTFEVSLETSIRLSAAMPAGVTRVSESGIFTRADVQRLQEAGFHAFLVGESLMKAGDPAGSAEGIELSAMTPPFIVKVCGVTTREDAQAALDAGANALGFNFYPQSPRYLSFEQAEEIIGALRGEYLRVGVFVNPAEEVTVPFLDVAQVHGAGRGKMSIWRAVNPGTLPAADSEVEAWLVDTCTPGFGGSGRTFDWSLMSGFPYRAIIAGGLDGNNVAEAIRIARPWGVDSCSRLESSLGRGRKDHGKVTAFVESALRSFQAGAFQAGQAVTI